MPQQLSISFPPKYLEDEIFIKRRVSEKLNIHSDRITHIQVLKRSIDARKRPKYILQLNAWVDEAFVPKEDLPFPLQNVSEAPAVHIIGMGPAGLFAALELIKQGLKPVIIERGKAVRDRRRDLARITKEGVVNPESNYCFGEGGAGTFSDGKLYTRSTKRGDTREILNILTQFGATSDILIDAHPHIGTNKLPKIITRMREAIEESGGEVHFDTSMTDMKVEAGSLTSIQLNGEVWIPVSAVILATGHSARDIFELLYQKRIEMKAKPFALGVRVEHPQLLIDEIQYHCLGARHPNLPAAAYQLTRQVRGRGVYSFCMCPGGIICPSATSNDEVVVNGWSPSRRDSRFANSGIVMEIGLRDMAKKGRHPLDALRFQRRVERKAFGAGGGKQVAPAQRLTDFVQKKVSTTLPDCSYLPGIRSVEMGEVLPKFVQQGLIQAFQAFGKRMKGYMTEEAVVLGVESRTSSPISIPRDPQTLSHPAVSGLIPCGEGAGYAGGIMSAAIDGRTCARAAVRRLSE
ncbi:MAG: FAD-dependent protein [Bacteroidota bacterium]